LTAINCKGLTKRYGQVTALDHLDLTVEEHVVFGFLGPNGAGKTTTVKLLTGLASPTAGQAWIDSDPIGSNALKSRIGYLPDVPAFYNWMSGREYLLFTGELFHLDAKEIKSRAGELLELVDLEKAAKRRVGGYSRGMKQRLGIAQALMSRPRVLFMDEPTSALDPIGRREVLELINRLKQTTTIFMSTHILTDVERVCDTVGIINKGKLVTVSSVADLQARYVPSVFELEFEEEPTAFIALLESQPWVSKIEKATSVTGNTKPLLSVRVKDVNLAKKALPQLIAQSRLGLLRYELARPSLEDIFVKLVGGAA
jgi:ABC-2 type transport system ATP-binding protein